MRPGREHQRMCQCQAYSLGDNNVDIDKSIEVVKVFTEIDSVETKYGKKFNCLVKYRAKILNVMEGLPNHDGWL